MAQLLFNIARGIDGTSADCPEGMQVLVERDQLADISLPAAVGASMHIFARNDAVLKSRLH